MLSLMDILEIENDPEILEFTCPGTDYLLWPLLRYPVMQMVINYEIYGTRAISAGSTTQRFRRLRQLGCLVDGLCSDMHFIGHRAKILFFSAGMTNIKIEGKYLNRVSDHFALCFPDQTLLIEDFHEYQHRKPRINQNVAYSIPVSALSRLASKWPGNRVAKSPIIEFVSFLSSRLASSLGFVMTDQQREHLQKTLLNSCARLKPDLQIYNMLFRRLSPTIIFFQNGCVGIWAPLIHLAKEMGIQTAEMQHGVVSRGDSITNFAPTILKSKTYRMYVPDFFLAYGQWWADQISIPAETVVVGNPHYETMRHKYRMDLISRHVILFISEGDCFPKFLEMVLALKTAGIPFKMLVRPHPAEKTSVFQKYGRQGVGAMIDYSDDLYQRLAESYAVIGESSTALFEAAGMVDRVFSMKAKNTQFVLPNNPFEQFSTVEELKEKLYTENSGRVSKSVLASFWASDWKENYRRFIAQTLAP